MIHILIQFPHSQLYVEKIGEHGDEDKINVSFTRNLHKSKASMGRKVAGWRSLSDNELLESDLVDWK